MRNKQAYLTLISFIIVAFLTGCVSRNPRPNPGSTIPTPASTTASEQSTGWNISEQPYQGNSALELQEREVMIPSSSRGGSSFGAGGGSSTGIDGAELTGMNPNAIATVYFGFDQSAIAPNERTKLQSLADTMRNDPQMRVIVEGHCDWRGTVEYNIALGERRAKSVVRYMSGLGIAESRFETLSKGDLEAAVEGTASQMAKDRRADVIPLK